VNDTYDLDAEDNIVREMTLMEAWLLEDAMYDVRNGYGDQRGYGDTPRVLAWPESD
jgi:hypothetical protein